LDGNIKCHEGSTVFLLDANKATVLETNADIHVLSSERMTESEYREAADDDDDDDDNNNNKFL
jgi:hypothetical protein